MDGKPTQKKCFKCDRLLSLDGFYKHPMMADGHLNKCKDCTKRDVHKNYKAHFEQYREYERRRVKLAHRKQLRIESGFRNKQKFPHKWQARRIMANAIRDGKLERQSCERCDSLRTHGHHEDYSKPLEVMWLCPLHHKERHRELTELGVVL